jgi:hypothetical protein
MIYLLSRTIKYLSLGAVAASALAIVAGAAAFVITFVVLIMILMIADAFLESTFVGLRTLWSCKSLEEAQKAFSSRFGKVADRYSQAWPRSP